MSYEVESIGSNSARTSKGVSLNSWEIEYSRVQSCNSNTPTGIETQNTTIVYSTSPPHSLGPLTQVNNSQDNIAIPKEINIDDTKNNSIKPQNVSNNTIGNFWLKGNKIFTWKEGNCKNEDQNESSDRVKTKLLSVWNNVKYGWTVKVKTNFSYDSAIVLLGKIYHRKNWDELAQQNKNSTIELFRQDFLSRIWFTYRREFQLLNGSNLTSDCGWGCMLRSGQMLFAQGLMTHFLGRDWRCNITQSQKTETLHRMIIRFFGDHMCSESPFSIHQLVALGENVGKKVGDWYGPASVVMVLKQALEKAKDHNPMLDQVCVYITQHCTVFKQDVIDLCTSLPRWQPQLSQQSSVKESIPESIVSSDFEKIEMPQRYSSSAPGDSPLHSSPLCSSFYYVPNSLEEQKTDVNNEESISSSYYCVPPEATENYPEYPSNTMAGSFFYVPANLGKENGETETSQNVQDSKPTVNESPPCFSRSISVPSTSNNTSMPTTQTDEFWRGVIILVPVRLGGETLNHLYIPRVRNFLAMENSLGIIGGKPRHSLYFVGWQDDKMIYLDPHYCQDTVDVCSVDFPLQSFHCPSPRKLAFNKMDPSCTLGFYCRTREEFMQFTEYIKEQETTQNSHRTIYPIFTVSEGRCSEMVDTPASLLEKFNAQVNKENCEEDDFVIL